MDPLDPFLLHSLGRLGKLPAQFRHGIEELYLNHYAKSTMPNATAEDIERAKTAWRAEARIEQLRIAVEHARPSGDDRVVGPGKPATRRSAGRRPDPALERLKNRVRKLRNAGLSHIQICQELDNDKALRAIRPRNVGWDKNLSMTQLIGDPKYKSAVKVWISRA